MQQWCKDCVQSSNERNGAIRYKRLKLEAIARYGGKCECCGEDEPAFLEIDHIGGGGGEHRGADVGARKIHTWLRDMGYPPGFRVLCRNCNWATHVNNGVCPHRSKR